LKQLQRLQFAFPREYNLAQGVKSHEFKSPILTSDQFMEKADDDIKEFIKALKGNG
jgi:hypothetical protein